MGLIDTPRLQLRELDLGDAEFILELLNEDGFVHFIGDKGVRSSADACSYLSKGPMDSYRRHGFGLYAACLRGGPAIGICGLVRRAGLSDPDVGFAFLSRYGAKGYAVEAAGAVLAHARAVLQLGRIVAITSPDNVKSIALLEKIGFRFERLTRLAEDSPEVRLFASEPGASRT